MTAFHFLLQTGQPILARQNPFVYLVIVAAIIIILIISIILLIVGIIQKQLRSQAYQERQKTAPTSRNHIFAVQKLCELTQTEAGILFAVCKKYNIPNIAYNYKNIEMIDKVFKRVFADLDRAADKATAEIRRGLLLSIRQKFEKVKNSQFIISSSKVIPVGIEMQYYDDSHQLYMTKLVQIHPDEMEMTMLKDHFGGISQPAPLSKIRLFFVYRDMHAYLMTVRVVRYQAGWDGPVMLLSHTNDLQMLQHRDFRRMQLTLKCLFSAVKIEERMENGQKKLSFVPSGKSYGATLLDISGGGCKLECNVDVKENQYIHLELQLGGDEPMSLAGLVVGAVDAQTPHLRVLHIRFVSLSQKNLNRILMTVYDYM